MEVFDLKQHKDHGECPACGYMPLSEKPPRIVHTERGTIIKRCDLCSCTLGEYLARNAVGATGTEPAEAPPQPDTPAVEVRGTLDPHHGMNAPPKRRGRPPKARP